MATKSNKPIKVLDPNDDRPSGVANMIEIALCTYMFREGLNEIRVTREEYDQMKQVVDGFAIFTHGPDDDIVMQLQLPLVN